MSYELKEYLKAINTSKERLMDSEDEQWEKKYPAYIVNKCLEPFQDTIFLVNEMNMNHQIDNKLQFDFLLNTLRTRNRYTPWLKATKECTRTTVTKPVKKSLETVTEIPSEEL